ncbi:hypothetical protein BpHYR1_009281 [Brachionus plicatilis]|uniref:Uncharacterized protein n=1 Tax=Brachionus plicatilis TaxID=10195 RepID=A0A3M7QAP7_BRAPC|nr:hypothetical protein BpHYR1_009281 [Brachionus plicatilis]
MKQSETTVVSPFAEILQTSTVGETKWHCEFWNKKRMKNFKFFNEPLSVEFEKIPGDQSNVTEKVELLSDLSKCYDHSID